MGRIEETKEERMRRTQRKREGVEGNGRRQPQSEREEMIYGEKVTGGGEGEEGLWRSWRR